MASLRQIGGVEEYVQEFELLVAQAKPSAEDQILGYFLAGLRQDIRSLVRPHDPRDLTRAMEVACDIEEARDQMWGLYLMQGHLEVQTVPKHPTVGLGIHKDPCLQWPNQVSLEAGELEPFLMLNMSRGETKEGVIIVEMLLDQVTAVPKKP